MSTISYDEFGRPVYSSTRPDSDFNEIFVRRSIGESEYKSVTFKVERRFADLHAVDSDGAGSRKAVHSQRARLIGQ